MITKNDLLNIKKLKERETTSRIYSLHGEIDNIDIVGECDYNNQHIYIARYQDKYCTAIFNYFVCDYYTDDVYGVIHDFELE